MKTSQILRKAISKVADPARRIGYELCHSEMTGFSLRPIGTSDSWKRIGRRSRPRGAFFDVRGGQANKAFRAKLEALDLVEVEPAGKFRIVGWPEVAS